MVSESIKTRLGRPDWVLAGYRALVRGGPGALKIEALARDIGATKGSFYWHFKGLSDLHAAMLDNWERLATAEITSAVQASGLAPVAQLRLLVEMVSILPGPEFGGAAVEPALRDWGRTESRARAVLERVDRQRLADLRGFLAAAGVRDVEAGALTLYAAVIGLENLRMTTGVVMRDPLHAVLDAVLRG